MKSFPIVCLRQLIEICASFTSYPMTGAIVLHLPNDLIVTKSSTLRSKMMIRNRSWVTVIWRDVNRLNSYNSQQYKCTYSGTKLIYRDYCSFSIFESKDINDQPGQDEMAFTTRFWNSHNNYQNFWAISGDSKRSMRLSTELEERVREAILPWMGVSVLFLRSRK